ncbi:adenosylmethionine--8-amino-7-oxononanoate transaminase [Corynebacterium pelargi]|uniref:Adenosylmethionine-8-amino-7-oxononanoate aminotransferase n=1 Tax=Corynebacterium pelargi TaxID=1471400 RepID=A0A410W920_9CORY|nr:adenosylmethionine--8-amino-7-oxononanoate transaminase [Corynebacterium pelargi]QAU52452.1 Adenosylmethionine-8-amino-7-oxononanoate aminotransferase [Corynebacterium pelargi]GGG67566.1 adenosylmethionine-8-amino-7-oxononanoate aminotransferase [Corynebacterium pelargi]
MHAEAIATYDRDHVWHPYGPMPAAIAPVVIDRAQGAYLYTTDGTALIDGMSSWWAAAHGHSHPKLQAAATKQIEQMSHVMFGGLTHRPAVELAKKLVDLSDDGLDKVFFSDSGSVAVEVGLKMAYQYQRGIGHPERDRMLTWRRGYHGDTFATMSLCDPDGGMHSMWTSRVMSNVFAPHPPTRGASQATIDAYLEQVEALIDDSIAGIAIEPIVQGAGGMRFHDPAIVRGLRALCDRYGLVLLADEIATGFGRTGALFATQAAGVTPDILCLGKALTGGFMSLAATMTTERIATAISSPEGGGALLHGPTFMGNPLACAVACAAVDLASDPAVLEQVAGIEQILQEELAPLKEHPSVADVRVLGAIGVVEMRQPVDMQKATQAVMEQGVWLRPFGKLVYTMPPYICQASEIRRICDAIKAVVQSEEQA